MEEKKKFLNICGLVLIGILSRFIPHLPNFTALNSVALFSPAPFFSSFLIMILCDSILGFHSSLFSVYLSVGLISLLGFFFKPHSARKMIVLSICSSLLFFAISNFGIWVEGKMYPQTFQGLITCYVAALPFLLNQMLGDLFYTTLFVVVRKFSTTETSEGIGEIISPR